MTATNFFGHPVSNTLVRRMDGTPTDLGGGVSRRRVLVLDGDKWKPRPAYRLRQGGNGFGINYEDVCYTLNTVDRHIVAILGD